MSNANNIDGFYVGPIHAPVQLSGLICRGAEDKTTRVVQLERETTGLISMKLMAAPREMTHILQSLGGSKVLKPLQNPLGSRLPVAFLQKADVIAFLAKPLILERDTHGEQPRYADTHPQNITRYFAAAALY